MLNTLIALLALGTLANCYTFNSTVRMRDGKCVYGSELKEDREDWYNPDFCERLTCRIVEDKAYIIITDCGVPSSPNPNCKIEKKEGNYPDCCPRIICP
ncbi:venom protein 30.1-like [Centruroides sculpturatus]|uniref:venom protein 30.1-like n=1 Tax=Centruroides sculpturatus TaxID=218467 RepID=UPI000C6DCB4E|nr:venom protein 30.1-like [Centruroides sculpturatus]